MKRARSCLCITVALFTISAVAPAPSFASGSEMANDPLKPVTSTRLSSDPDLRRDTGKKVRFKDVLGTRIAQDKLKDKYAVMEYSPPTGLTISMGGSIPKGSDARRAMLDIARFELGDKAPGNADLEEKLQVRQLATYDEIADDSQEVHRRASASAEPAKLTSESESLLAEGATAAACGGDFRPYVDGWLVRRHYPAGAVAYGRIVQNFTWRLEAAQNLRACPRVTYEADFYTDNTDGLHLMGNDRNSRDILSWSSNLPQAYLDTRFDDDPRFIYYTVGSSAGANITAGVAYYTLVRSTLGNTNSDRARMQTQRGHYTVDALGNICKGPACNFADQTLDLKTGLYIPSLSDTN